MDSDLYNQMYLMLFHVGISITMFLTLGLYALICLIIKKKQLEAIKLLKWGYLSGILGAICYFSYYQVNSDATSAGIEDILVLGFMVGGGYGMTIFSLIDGARKLMPNKSVKQTD